MQENGTELAPTPGLEVLEHHPHLRPSSAWTSEKHATPPRPERRGRSWICIAAASAAVTAVIVAAIVGGGVGGSLASTTGKLATCQTNLTACQSAYLAMNPQDVTVPNPQALPASGAAPPETTAAGTSLTDYKVAPAQDVISIDVDCSALNNTIQTTPKKDDFHVYCGVDFGSGKRVDGQGRDIILADIVGINAYSLPDCLQACSQYNFESKKWGSPLRCGAVTLAVDMAKKPDGNCWLKNSTLTHTAGGGASSDSISATMVD
ncbi:hypothetical protein GGR50DRAFT_509194 [Xylaria sp. CBS 124048]|nr:hypothetical protein GGR50DRAFT_509194 [Xylaria sp. CBS 124048]